MSFTREDFYDECKYYCQITELIEILDNLIFDSDYDPNLNKGFLLWFKEYCKTTLERMEKRRVGWVLKE